MATTIFVDWSVSGTERPKAGINAFASVFQPQLRLVKDGYRRIWQKVPRGS